jgi:hypothetical protein
MTALKCRLDETMTAMALSRRDFYAMLARHSNRHGLVVVNACQLATDLGCDRKSIGRMIDDLAKQGRLRRFRHRGPKGLVIQLLPLKGKADGRLA